MIPTLAHLLTIVLTLLTTGIVAGGTEPGLEPGAQPANETPIETATSPEADPAEVSTAHSGFLGFRLDRRKDRIDAVCLQIDNDLFAGHNQDRDYSGGIGITISGERARDGWLSLDPWLGRLDRLVSKDQDGETHFSRQVGLMVFTPGNAAVAEAQHDDRPYASLLFQSNGRVRVDQDHRGAWASSLTIGVLGLSVSERLHVALHGLVGSDPPRGYDHQISDGGEPTARYTLARLKLWSRDPSGRVKVKTAIQGSLGFVTEASASISLSAGKFNPPWWSPAPELTNYMSAPVPTTKSTGGRELHVFLGARVKARAYNALVQGQFRDSDVRFTSARLEKLLADAWIGVAMQLQDRIQLTYSLRYQSAELRQASADRDLLWGAVLLSYTF